MKIFINGELVREFSGTELLKFTTQDEPNCVKMTFEIQGDCGDLALPIGTVNVRGSAHNVAVQTGNVTVGGDIMADARVKTGQIHANAIKGEASSECGSVFVGGQPVQRAPQAGAGFGAGAGARGPVGPVGAGVRGPVGPVGPVGVQGPVGANAAKPGAALPKNEQFDQIEHK